MHITTLHIFGHLFSFKPLVLWPFLCCDDFFFFMRLLLFLSLLSCNSLVVLFLFVCLFFLSYPSNHCYRIGIWKRLFGFLLFVLEDAIFNCWFCTFIHIYICRCIETRAWCIHNIEYWFFLLKRILSFHSLIVTL